MGEFLQKTIDFLVKVLKKIRDYLVEIKILLKSEHKEITVVLLIVLGLQTIMLCCFTNKLNTREVKEPTKSVSEIESTIIAELVEQTRSALVPTIAEMTPTIALIPTLEPTKNQLETIYDKYDCVPKNEDYIYGQVVEIVDGDTIKVKIGLETYSLRYIGIDCPECSGTSESSEIYAQEAVEQNRNLVEGKEVLLIKDISDVDQYDRLLRYVFVDNTFVNYYLVKHGYAHASMYPPDVACSSYLASAEEEATSNKIGFWSAVFTPPTQTPEPTVDPREGCDPCYPTVCIPDVSYDLDCGEIAYKRFSVTCDPHGFDGDNDGIGCEK